MSAAQASPEPVVDPPPDDGPGDGPGPAWAALADALLGREVVRWRARRAGAPADPFAGVRVDGDEVDRLLAALPGLGGPADGPADGDRTVVEEAVARARAGLADELDGDSLFAGIVHHARLPGDEVEALALLAAVDLDPGRQRLVGYLQDDVGARRVTLSLLGRLLGPAGPVAVGADSRLRRAGLAEVGAAGPWAVQPVALAAAVAWALAGDPSLDPDLPLGARPVRDPDGPAAGAELLFVTGPDRLRRLRAAVHGARGRAFLVTPPPVTDEAWRAVVREATVSGLGVVLELDGQLAPEARHWIERADHLPWAVTSRHELPLADLPARPWAEHRVDDVEVSGAEWAAAVGASPRTHRLVPEQMPLLAGAYQAHGRDLDAAVRRLAAGEIEHLTSRVRPRRTWDDLVLAPDRKAHLRELATRYRHRDTVYGDWGFRAVPSAGLVAMFAGESGTGKTLAAEILAGSLGLDLFKLDLSSVVSKYIGETEKNLERIFDAAGASSAVLFFDEADSVFGKRSEVSEAKDRYANIEVSYLLQRIEAYDGLIVLATNFQNNIDQAFLRRIHVSIEFPVPDAAERLRIWQRCLPSTAPVGPVDLGFVAERFRLTGGSIRNATLTAAFLAAEAGTPITMETVLWALKREYQKLGRLVTEAEFGDHLAFVNGPGPLEPPEPDS